MKKFYFTYLLIFFTVSESLSQIKYFEIEPRANGMDIHLTFQREPFSVTSDNGKNVAVYKNFMDEGLPGAPALPSKTIFIAIPPASKVNAFLSKKKENYIPNINVKVNPRIKQGDEENIIYKDAEPDLNYFIYDNYPLNNVEVLGYTWIRDFYCVVIKINTHFYNWKKREITELFDADLTINFVEQKPFTHNTSAKGIIDEELSQIILNYESASEYRSFQSDYFSNAKVNNWIDYSLVYVKLAVSQDGIHRITYDDLQNYGISVSQVNPKTLRIYHNGNEIPVYVAGEDDLSFDPGDYIEFWMTKNYNSDDYRRIVNQGEDYINYLNRYNDTAFVWLTWNGDNGLRPGSVDEYIPGLTDSVKSHLVKIHLERNFRLWYYDAVAAYTQYPFWQENKVWTWETLGGSGSRAFHFGASNFIPDTEVKTISRAISYAGDTAYYTHRLGCSINSGTPQDTLIFNYKETVNFSSSFSSNSLSQGNNIYRVFGLPSQASVNTSLIDWIDIEYFRYNVAANDSLLIIVPDSVQSALRVITVENLSSPSFFVYKISPQFKRVTNYIFSEGVLAFTDTVSGGDRYFVINENYFRTPEFRIKKQFINLSDENRGADYIIISNKVLQQSVENYKSFIASTYDVRVEAAYIDDIYDEFGFGVNDAESIQKFLKTVYTNWQSPKPSFLNLIGDANYDYKRVIIPPSGFRNNLVPSFGHPVSDSWYVMWDSSDINIAQMYVGRIPANTNNDVQFYLQKHQQYIDRNFDEWNKEFLFFSGGEIENPTQLNQIKQTNDYLFNNVVKPAPVGGTGTHLYKTINPPTNFGPYSNEEIKNAIGNGGLFISYIGHSGTQTWDNGIRKVSDLRSDYSNKHALISDFGCSTGKFAEPDYEAFGELFIVEQPDGHAISYLGNSSWGYLTTSLRFPSLFYSRLLVDTITTIGKAHWLAKLKQFNDFGFSEVNKVFNYCNLLFGDPIVSFKTPLKPNFAVRENSFKILTENANDMTDSVLISIGIFNTGRVPEDSLDVNIKSFWLGSVIYEKDLKVPSPLYHDTLRIYIPIARRVGQHTVNVQLDKNNFFDEIYKDDNFASFSFYVFSTSARPIEIVKYYTGRKTKLNVLNPTILSQILPEQLLFSIADNPDFTSAVNTSKNFETIHTALTLGSLTQDKRYWWRVKINNPDQEWSDAFSFRNINRNFGWYIDDTFHEEDVEYFNTKFDSSSSSWILTSSENTLVVESAGSDDGEYGSMFYNDREMLPTTFYWGIQTAEIDTLTLKPSNFKLFLFWDGNADELLMNYLDSLPMGSVVAMTICADGAQSVLGFDGGTPVRRTIEGWGSLYVDSVRYRDSWCIIGKKGAPIGTVPEGFSRQFSGPAQASTSNFTSNDTGYVIFPAAGKSVKWKDIEKKDLVISGTSIEYFPLAIKSNGEVDTLSALNFTNNIASLNSINSEVYPYLKILTKLKNNDLFQTPSVKSLGINFEQATDLAINYQVVSVNHDTVNANEPVRLDFKVYNPTETKADSFKVLTELLDNNNSVILSWEDIVSSLAPLSNRSFFKEVNTLYLKFNYTFKITIDPDNRIDEFFEDNNFYSVSFYVKPDTSVPSIRVTFDGEDIFDGNYITADPEIRVELFDPSPFPVNDTSFVTVFLNDEQIYYVINPEILRYEFKSSDPKMIVKYTPHLSTGEYTLKVFGKNYMGNLADSAGYEKYFVVDEEIKMFDVYNYPNPFVDETFFTFRLTQIPDIIRIRIFSVSGRLIRELEVTPSMLNYNFNTIRWNGKDQDKNDIANGVYFYKVIMTKNGVSQTVTSKLAKVK